MNKKTLLERVGSFVARHPFLYYILTFTWGLLATLVGYLVLLVLLIFRRGRVVREGYHLFFEFYKDTEWGFSIGAVSFIGRIRTHSDKEVLYHEFGHTVHNAILGPLVLFLVYIPSFIRYHYIEYLLNRKMYDKLDQGKGYDDIWFEGSATNLGLYWQKEYLWKKNKRRNKNK